MQTQDLIQYCLQNILIGTAQMDKEVKAYKKKGIKKQNIPRKRILTTLKLLKRHK